MTHRYLIALLTVALAVPCTAPLAAEDGEKLFYENRDEIPEAYRWDLTDIYPDRAAFDAARAEVEAMLPGFDDFKGKLAESPAMLAGVLDLDSDLSRKLAGVFVYANETNHLDTSRPEGNELVALASALGAKASEATSFIQSEIVTIPAERLAEFLEDAGVARHAHNIDDIVRTREHTRSTEVEEVLAASSQLRGAPHQAYSSLANADVEWPSVEDENGEMTKVVPGQYIKFVTSPDRALRERASLALFGTYDQYANTFAATLGGNIHKDIWIARTRGYESTLEMALDGSNVPRSVVDTLVSTVHDNLHQVHEYADLRREIMGLDKLHIYDMYVPLAPDADIQYSFEEGWALAMEFWRETFGEEYAAVAARALEERWIDVYTNEGKRPGAYAWGTYDTHPYLLLNWTGKFDAVSTLVHEMGHCVHRYLTDGTQPFHYSSYSLFVAEVASVASESLFLEWMLERTEDPEARLLLINHAMDSVTTTFLRQIFFHEWEAGAHAMAERGEPITKESLGDAYGKLWQDYYGEHMVVDDEYKAGWSRVNHFYRTFYVWVYATSYAAGEAIAERFRSGDQGAVQDYLAMLRLGGSVYPMDALKRAGVDMNDPSVIRAVMDRYGTLRGQLAAELGGGDDGS